jgi:hypothetical protein
MEFPINMTGYAHGLHLFRCICKGCSNEYFLHPASNLVADSGLCPICEDLARQVDACSGKRVQRFEFRALTPEYARKKVVSDARLFLMGILALLFALYGFWKY